MSNKTQIANLALERNGASQFIADVDTENSVEAQTVKLVFDNARDYVLKAHPWPFATSYAVLALVAGSSSSKANYDWTYAYRYPSDCLDVRRIVTTGGRRETQPPPYRVGRDSQGRLIYTDQEQAQIEYTVRITDSSEFDAIFVSALAWYICAITPALSRIKGQTEVAMQMYSMDISKASAAALNEGQPVEPLEAEWVRSR